MAVMEQPTTIIRAALMTAITGTQVAGVGNIIEESSTNLRVEMTFAGDPGSLVPGELFRVESGDEIIVTELRAYRLDERGACLLLGALHRASVRELEKLAQQYDVEWKADHSDVLQTMTLRSASFIRRTPLLGAEIEGVISRMRLFYSAAAGTRSRKPRLVPAQ